MEKPGEANVKQILELSAQEHGHGTQHVAVVLGRAEPK